mgnify:CR=1 FL=1
MAVTFQLPADVERRLRAETPNLEAAAKEAMLATGGIFCLAE